MAQRVVSGQILDVPDFDSKTVDIKIGTILRLVFLIAAYVNQFCETIGAYNTFIPVQYQEIVKVVSLIATALASIAAYWFNNSWTPEATVIDKVLSTLKYSAKYCPEIVDQIKNNVVEAGKLNVEIAYGGTNCNVDNGTFNDVGSASVPKNPVDDKDKMQN